jgi:hypothetical protein
MGTELLRGNGTFQRIEREIGQFKMVEGVDLVFIIAWTRILRECFAFVESTLGAVMSELACRFSSCDS